MHVSTAIKREGEEEEQAQLAVEDLMDQQKRLQDKEKRITSVIHELEKTTAYQRDRTFPFSLIVETGHGS